jgi:hypothetical protein
VTADTPAEGDPRRREGSVEFDTGDPANPKLRAQVLCDTVLAPVPEPPKVTSARESKMPRGPAKAKAPRGKGAPKETAGEFDGIDLSKDESGGASEPESPPIVIRFDDDSSAEAVQPAGAREEAPKEPAGEFDGLDLSKDESGDAPEPESPPAAPAGRKPSKDAEPSSGFDGLVIEFESDESDSA